jgi:hypothetical protein
LVFSFAEASTYCVKLRDKQSKTWKIGRRMMESFK